MKRVWIPLSVVGVLLLGVITAGVVGQIRIARRQAAQDAAYERIAAAHQLELSVAAIAGARRGGQVTHFALVPSVVPPGVVRVETSVPLADDGVTDLYSYGEMKVVVNFTGVPGAQPCAGQPCVRDGELPVRTGDAPSLGHVAIWVLGSPSADVEAVRRFWAGAEFVRVADAAWFAELAAQGDIYARR
ncbi:hypothetical protein [Actinoplanes sp. NPDC020271]|uniref:hypothetical protein n=1 Tax=Actinoplanes sp. NPDC020271 TaxID=3363896 RepID=UPI0037B6BF4F